MPQSITLFTLKRLCFALIFSVLVLPVVAEEGDVPGAPHLLPEDTLAYIRFDDVDQLREDSVNSSLGKMLADPADAAVCQRRLPHDG